MNFKEYEKFLSECIEKYRLSLSEWAVLSFFLKKIRKNEILFLEKVIKYNLEFKLLWDNGVDYKIEFLKDFYSLRNIYGYFYASVNAALYKLDYLPDQERKFLKNRIYSNIFKSENDRIFFEKDLPLNYSKSKFVEFLEEKYGLECVWENVSVNEFIEKLYIKFSELGLVVSG